MEICGALLHNLSRSYPPVYYYYLIHKQRRLAIEAPRRCKFSYRNNYVHCWLFSDPSSGRAVHALSVRKPSSYDTCQLS